MPVVSLSERRWRDLVEAAQEGASDGLGALARRTRDQPVPSAAKSDVWMFTALRDLALAAAEGGRARRMDLVSSLRRVALACAAVLDPAPPADAVAQSLPFRADVDG